MGWTISDLANKRVECVSHDDYDGYCCVIPLHRGFANLHSEHVDYSKYLDTISSIIKRTDIDVIIISDLSLKQNPETERLILEIDDLSQSGLVEVFLFDHHQDSLWLNDYPWARIVVDGMSCGTSLVYDFMVDQTKSSRLDKLSPLVDMVADYDLYKFKLLGTAKLQLLFTVMGGKRFIDRCLLKTNPHLMNETELGIIDMKQELDDQYVRETIAYSWGIWTTDDMQQWMYAMVFAEQLISRVGHKFVSNGYGYDFCVIINPRRNEVSLRSRPGVNVKQIANDFGGGGHELAAGFPINISYLGINSLTELNELRPITDQG